MRNLRHLRPAPSTTETATSIKSWVELRLALEFGSRLSGKASPHGRVGYGGARSAVRRPRSLRAAFLPSSPRGRARSAAPP
jgi:hypothetical protein